jgi:radical SAM superfamily enzyme YgiQ (UPF0313 family)
LNYSDKLDSILEKILSGYKAVTLMKENYTNINRNLTHREITREGTRNAGRWSTVIRRIHFVEFNAKVNTLAMRTSFPKYGTVLLATLLRDRGFDVKIYLEGVSQMDFSEITSCDLICLPLFAPAYNKVKDFAEMLMKERPHLPIIIGGPHAILYPETVLGFCHYVVRCEGDDVLPELINCLSEERDPHTIAGISFLREGQVIHTPDRPPPTIPTTIPDYGLIQGFRRISWGFGRLLNVQNTLQTSRGCKFNCRFCPTGRLFGQKYRNRDVDSIIADIRDKQRYNDWIFVVDNSFEGDKKRTKELLNRLVREDLCASFIVFARHEIGRDTEMLQLMKRAGIECLIVGVESLVDENLRAFNKGQTRDEVTRSLRNIKRHGIHVIATFAFGYDWDTKEDIRAITDMVREGDLSLNIFVLHDIDMDKDGDLLIPLKRRFMTYYQRTDPDDTSFYDYLTGSFVTYFPKRMKPSTLQQCILDAYDSVYTRGYLLWQIFKRSIFEALFGLTHGFGIRRLNASIRTIVDRYYMDYLRSIEEGLYDENEILIEERLDSIERLPLPRPLPNQVDLNSSMLIMLLAYVPPMTRFYCKKGLLKLKRRWSVLRGRTTGVTPKNYIGASETK